MVFKSLHKEDVTITLTAPSDPWCCTYLNIYFNIYFILVFSFKGSF
jgi:hypothetical protein